MEQSLGRLVCVIDNAMAAVARGRINALNHLGSHADNPGRIDITRRFFLLLVGLLEITRELFADGHPEQPRLLESDATAGWAHTESSWSSSRVRNLWCAARFRAMGSAGDCPRTSADSPR